jgi:hypothetical protein
MPTTPENHRKDLSDCIATLAKRADDLNEGAIASVLYTLSGAIGQRIETELAKITSEFSLYILLYNKINQTLDEQEQNNSGGNPE